MKILVPIDFSEVTDSVILEAIKEAKAFGADIELLHVLQYIPEVVLYDNSMPYVPMEENHELLEEQQLKLLKKSEKKVMRADVNCISILREGSPAAEIINYAADSDIDRIILGSHGHGALYHLVLGSVSEKVIDKVKCTAVVVKK
jgi:nucleotide-binding universal stress UspA family protein